MDGEPGIGKSTITEQMILVNVGGEGADNDGKIIGWLDKNGRETDDRCVQWLSCWSPETKQQNTVRDCKYTLPYKLSSGLKTVDVAKRQYPGFEILEHSYEAPDDIVAMRVEIQHQDNGLRQVNVSIENISEDASQDLEMFWDEFLDHVSKAPEMHA